MSDVDPAEKQRIREKIEKLKSSKFKQQTLPAWRPVPTAMSTMLTFGVFSVIFLAIGILLLVMSNGIMEVEKQYNDICYDSLTVKETVADDANCTSVDHFIIEKDIETPVYIYYQLDNFYQNHRRYVKSRSNDQLNGKYLSVEDLSDCDPIIKVSSLWINQQQMFKKDQPDRTLEPDAPAIPCGLVAKSLFNDTYWLYKCDDNDPDCTTTDFTKKQSINISTEDIAWSSDVKYKFNNIKDAPDSKTWDQVQWMDMTDQHFIVWMRTAGLPNFRKLWGHVDNGLKQGSYKVIVQNNYEVQPFQGKKHFVMSTTNALGGKNYFLASCYIIVGGLCTLFAFVFLCVYLRQKGQQGGGN